MAFDRRNQGLGKGLGHGGQVFAQGRHQLQTALLHLRLSSDVSTSRSTLTAIREAAKKARHA